MPTSIWTEWPSREALSRAGMARSRRAISWAVRVLLLGGVLWSALSGVAFQGWHAAVSALVIIGCAAAAWGFYRFTVEHRLWPSVTLLALLMGAALAAQQADAVLVATVLWCALAITAMERLPIAAAIPCTLVALSAYALVDTDAWLTTLTTTAGLALAGYVLRLDAEARGNTMRMLVQERAARTAEAESAALAERARIAREIHDVLAHSLSAQMVHLEAARLLIERGADRDKILERVVAARGMAREGLAETRQALSALRGEMTPVEEFLRELTESQGVAFAAVGEPRRVPPEAGLAVRRVAQEALTNVRKHAPGARTELRLDYLDGEVSLEVRDWGGDGTPGDLGSSGAGYGLLGMRERAELLGGSLESGPAEEGLVVRLRVPA
ncbi:sensor histidine kinase [Streptomyces sp. H27-D2]|uniref:sensor histidine kinase n=1 Tax=Streptomyces sp. H27-D2 TaxID=3046304 RepID=UPI002DBBEFCC|nr:histidine kinase [Streptomyces sp. H27-D2]MEC4015841.1 histidine kinase [Streptomyces sp. H27-D2]